MDWLGAVGGISDIIFLIGTMIIGTFQYFTSIYG